MDIRVDVDASSLFMLLTTVYCCCPCQVTSTDSIGNDRKKDTIPSVDLHSVDQILVLNRVKEKERECVLQTRQQLKGAMS